MSVFLVAKMYPNGAAKTFTRTAVAVGLVGGEMALPEPLFSQQLVE